MRFRSRLERMDGDSVLIETTSERWILRDLLAVDFKRVIPLFGARVAIQVTSPARAVRMLLALDGVAQSILLVSASLPEPHLEKFLELSRCNYLFTDNPARINSRSPLTVFRDVDELPKAAVIERMEKLETEWHLATSGTSGEPKLVSHSLASLTRTSRIGDYPSESIRWGLLYEFTRFAGLQVLLQSLLSGARLISPPTEASVRERVRQLISGGCTHLSATPSMWRSIAMTPEAQSLRLQQITLGGEIADDSILKTLGAMYPAARIVHIYASTEAGVGFAVKDGRAGFPEEYLTEPPGGVALRIHDGRLWIKNAQAIGRYVGSQESFEAAEGWIDTGDMVELVGERVRFLGRASGQINSGGNKFNPEEVEAVLLSHPSVLQARVYARSSSMMGAIVVAQVVQRDAATDRNQLRQDLKRFAAAKLESYKVPAMFELCDALPVLPSGKLQR